MGAGFYAQVEKILRANGGFLVRQDKDRHEIWQSNLSAKRFFVPVTVDKRTTANAILKQAGIDQKVWHFHLGHPLIDVRTSPACPSAFAAKFR
jgi:hypothetical protein